MDLFAILLDFIRDYYGKYLPFLLFVFWKYILRSKRKNRIAKPMKCATVIRCL